MPRLAELELSLPLPYSRSMSLTLEQVAKEAMQLAAAARALLAERMVESLDSGEIDDVQRAWAAEAIRRRDDVRSGRVQPVAGGDVVAEVRRAVGR